MSAEGRDGSRKVGAHMGGSHGDASQILPHPGSNQNDGDQLDNSAIIRHVSTIHSMPRWPSSNLEAHVCHDSKLHDTDVRKTPIRVL